MFGSSVGVSAPVGVSASAGKIGRGINRDIAQHCNDNSHASGHISIPRVHLAGLDTGCVECSVVDC